MLSGCFAAHAWEASRRRSLSWAPRTRASRAYASNGARYLWARCLSRRITLLSVASRVSFGDGRLSVAASHHHTRSMQPTPRMPTPTWRLPCRSTPTAHAWALAFDGVHSCAPRWRSAATLALCSHAGALHDLRVLLRDVGGEWLELGRWVGGPPLATMPWDAQPCASQQEELLRACERIVHQMRQTAAALQSHGPFGLYAQPFPRGARDTSCAGRPDSKAGDAKGVASKGGAPKGGEPKGGDAKGGELEPLRGDRASLIAVTRDELVCTYGHYRSRDLA